MAGILFIVATPLGNLGDITERAVHVLRTVGAVAAEDTRRARKLLAHVGARPSVHSLHSHSPDSRLDFIERLLGEGTDVAYVSDAGTPAVSDPGAELVRRALAAGAAVIPIPGPSAVTAALSAAGLPADRYVFLGFLPRKGKDRARLMQQVAGSEWTVVLFEAANRLVRLLTDLVPLCGGDRVAMVARELTKLHEEIRRGNLSELVVHYAEHPPKGEVTVLVSGRAPVDPPPDRQGAADRAVVLLGDGLSRKDVAAMVAQEFSLPRKEAYQMVVRL